MLLVAVDLCKKFCSCCYCFTFCFKLEKHLGTLGDNNNNNNNNNNNLFYKAQLTNNKLGSERLQVANIHMYIS